MVPPAKAVALKPRAATKRLETQHLWAFIAHPRPCKVDCAYTDWSDWTACEPYCLGKQRRSRQVRAQPQNGGQECAQEAQEMHVEHGHGRTWRRRRAA